MFKEAPNVVVEEAFRNLVTSGFRPEVICAEPARKQHGQWVGHWYFRAVSEQTGEEFLLVTARGDRGKATGDLAPRYFRTMSGVVGFLAELGCNRVDIPIEKGIRALQPAIPEAKPETKSKSRT